MTTMISELYDAFKEAKVSDGAARKAAEAVAAYETRFGRIELQLERVEGRLTQLTWAVGMMATSMIAVGIPCFWLLLRMAAKVGALS